MNGFNYFSFEYHAKGAKKSLGIKGVVIIFAFLLILCALVYAFISFQVLQRQSQLAFLQDIKLNADFNQQYTTAVKIEERMKQAEQEAAFLNQLSTYSRTLDTGSRKLVDLIDNCMVSGTQLTRISVSGMIVSLDGYIKNIEMLTTIEKSLRETGQFSFVLVKAVENEGLNNGMFKFSCQMTLNGGAVTDEVEK